MKEEKKEVPFFLKCCLLLHCHRVQKKAMANLRMKKKHNITWTQKKEEKFYLFVADECSSYVKWMRVGSSNIQVDG